MSCWPDKNENIAIDFFQPEDFEAATVIGTKMPKVPEIRAHMAEIANAKIKRNARQIYAYAPNADLWSPIKADGHDLTGLVLNVKDMKKECPHSTIDTIKCLGGYTFACKDCGLRAQVKSLNWTIKKA